eukprot:CAMPEP_0206267112 /NCGR_PEP_ID=MMETSP0047_2-20121206/30966_1 /ASSEMBLY_ACC=CAM_ASM_000192 /TAXON_ID=195065 /ORGANISM="Chroomonas mesostigmatica_cf, Strain CCMP1168" /LENGTH=171 /DNA_ID=CAMNT_0053695275 /DNA_START=3 /DNA_END=515 /DNA_ORIENTATION=+
MAPPDRASRAPLWAQVFFLIRTGHYQDALDMVERYSFRPTIKKALRAWVQSGGTHRIGRVGPDGLLDDALTKELDVEYCEYVLPGKDIWKRAVYSIVNERAAPSPDTINRGGRGDAPCDLRELPSIYGINVANIAQLRPAHTRDTSSPGWGQLWSYIQDILWRHLVFVRPD